MYTRASASDYDDFQAKGWTTKELLPLMRKHETYQRSCNNRDLHGFEGPIKVSFGNYTYPIKDDFLRAAESQGIPVTDDLQDLTTGHGAEHWLKWINRDTGRRSDSAHGYVHSTRAVHQNLHLMLNTKVEKASRIPQDITLCVLIRSPGYPRRRQGRRRQDRSYQAPRSRPAAIKDCQGSQTDCRIRRNAQFSTHPSAIWYR